MRSRKPTGNFEGGAMILLRAFRRHGHLPVVVSVNYSPAGKVDMAKQICMQIYDCRKKLTAYGSM